MWQRLEAFPAPCFDCGEGLRCQQEVEFCDVEHSDVGGIPDSYDCRELPACGEATCECVATEVAYDACMDEGDGVIAAHFGG